MTALVLDIETTATAAALAARPADEYVEESRKQPSNLKDPAKIAEWRERENARQIEARAEWDGQAAAREQEYAKTCALSPRLGRIVCAGRGCIVDEFTVDVDVFMARDEDVEIAALEWLWGSIDDANGQIITFNGLGFDVPFFLFRSMVNGVKPTVPVKTLRDWQRRYSYGPHFDCRAVLTQWDNRTTGTLTDWAECLGCNVPQTVSGSDITDLYNAGDFDAIAEHCRADVQTTKALYQRCASIYGEIGQW